MGDADNEEYLSLLRKDKRQTCTNRRIRKSIVIMPSDATTGSELRYRLHQKRIDTDDEGKIYRHAYENGRI